MSSDAPLVITPRDVVEERNLLRTLQNAFGIDAGDLDADDSMRAAIVWNTARTAELLDFLAEDPIDVPPPEIDVGDILLDISDDILRDVFGYVERRQLYDVSTSSSTDNVLSQYINPTSDQSSFRIGVTLDTNTTFSMRVEPENDPNYTTQLNAINGALEANSKYEFQFDVDPDAEINFRTGAAATVTSLRVVEVFVE